MSERTHAMTSYTMSRRFAPRESVIKSECLLIASGAGIMEAESKSIEEGSSRRTLPAYQYVHTTTFSVKLHTTKKLPKALRRCKVRQDSARLDKKSTPKNIRENKVCRGQIIL